MCRISFNINFHGFLFLSSLKRAITCLSFMNFMSSFSGFHPHLTLFSRFFAWNVKIIWPAKQEKKNVFLCFTSVLFSIFHFPFLLFWLYLFDIRARVFVCLDFIIAAFATVLSICNRMSMMSNGKMKDSKPQEPSCQSNHQLENTLNV